MHVYNSVMLVFWRIREKRGAGPRSETREEVRPDNRPSSRHTRRSSQCLTRRCATGGDMGPSRQSREEVRDQKPGGAPAQGRGKKTRRAPGRVRAKQHDAGELFRRVIWKARDPLIESQQDACFGVRRRKDDRVARAGRPFVKDGVCFMSELTQIVSELGWNVLVQFESHLTRIGTSRSWCASSAA